MLKGLMVDGARTISRCSEEATLVASCFGFWLLEVA